MDNNENTESTIDEYLVYASEIVKCMEDPIYFANTYFSITTPYGDQGIKTSKSQNEMIRAMVEKDRLAVLAPRQVGKTTSYIIAMLHLCLFSQNQDVHLLANRGADAVEIMSKIRLAYDHLPKWLKLETVYRNKRDIKFTNGSRIFAGPCTPDAGRGRSMKTLVIDECAFIRTTVMEDFWHSSYPVIASIKDSKVILISSYNGEDNFFQDVYNKGYNNDNWSSLKIKENANG